MRAARRPPGGVSSYAVAMDDRALGDTIEACRSLISDRFPDGQHGAAAMLLGDGTVRTGTAPVAVNPAVELCHETEPFCGAHRLGQSIVASVCLHRWADGRFVVLSPCGVCRERLAVHGPQVLVAVADAKDPCRIIWKRLGEILPDYWMAAFPGEVDAGWAG